jgi:hypothetical protein
MDETSLSNGGLYTVPTDRERHGGRGCLVAIVADTKSEDVIEAPEKLPSKALKSIREITIDLPSGE